MTGNIGEMPDYYKILQVQQHAEPEVIEGAYRKLSKKYHPDRNKEPGIEEKMKEINYAYSVLKNSSRRKEYDIQYIQYNKGRNTPDRESSNPSGEKDLGKDACEILNRYFDFLSRGAYENAYKLISDKDKRHIKKQDFIEWQKSVCLLYEIEGYRCILDKVTDHSGYKNMTFHYLFDFKVQLTEIEKKTGKIHDIFFHRVVVQEKDNLRVYLGYKDIHSIIDKLKAILDEIEQADEFKLDRAELMLRINNEIDRAIRYERPFSIILLEAVNYWQIEKKLETGSGKAVFADILGRIAGSIRSTDYLGRWSKNRAIFLLPETQSAGALSTAEKIISSLRKYENESKREDKLEYCAGISAFKNCSFQEMLENAISHLTLAREKGIWG